MLHRLYQRIFRRYTGKDWEGWMPPRGGGYIPGVNTGPVRKLSAPPGPPPKGGAGIGRQR